MKPFIIKTAKRHFDIEVSIDDGVLMLCLKDSDMQKQSYKDFIEDLRHDKATLYDARKAIKIVDLMGVKYETHVRRKNIYLELTPEQADTLYTVFQFIAGSEGCSRRRYIDEVSEMLEERDAVYNKSDIEPDNYIYFKSQSK